MRASQLEIGHQQIESLTGLEKCYGLPAVGGCDDGVSVSFHRVRQKFTDEVLVLDEKYFGFVQHSRSVTDMKPRAQITSLFNRVAPVMSGMGPLIAMLLLSGAAKAEGLAIAAEAQTRTEACGGAAASVNGAENVVTFTGNGKTACTGLQIRGENNIVIVALAAGALIDIEGSHNKVVFSAMRGALPRLRVSGSFADVRPASGSPAPSAETAVLLGDNATIELDCASRAVTLQGNHNRFRLRGACSALTVRGETNTVRAELAPMAPVLVEGNTISIVYTVLGGGTEPRLTVRGLGSTAVRQDRPEVLDTPGVNGAMASVPILMRDLNGAVMQQGTLAPLPEAVFIGTSLSPAGEAQLARLVALIDQINPSGLRLTGRDADISVAREHTTLVRTWLVAHTKKALPMQEASEVGQPGVDVMILR